MTFREGYVDCLSKLAINESGYYLKLLGDNTLHSDDI
jgi:hypothetical protein